MKRIVCSILILFCLLSVSVEANVLDTVMNQSGWKWKDTAVYHVGSYTYWQDRIIEQKNWDGKNCPAPMMGDANLDGKVDTKDALVALWFGLNGNVLTIHVVSPARQSVATQFNHLLEDDYHNGTISEVMDNPNFWVLYCQFNSPFFADVTKDCVVNSKDALHILRYTVGKATNFPVNDFTSVSWDFVYLPKPDEYYSGIYNDLVVE